MVKLSVSKEPSDYTTMKRYWFGSWARHECYHLYVLSLGIKLRQIGTGVGDSIFLIALGA